MRVTPRSELMVHDTPLIQKLITEPERLGVQGVATLHETHISWVILAGDRAFKIKKPLDLGFLDYSSLEKRKTMCEREVALNRRTAPNLYLGVHAITGSTTDPVLNGQGPAIEYAVAMRRFDEQNLAAHALAQNRLTSDHIDDLAHRLTQFHAQAERAEPTTPWGLPETVGDIIDDCLRVLRAAPVCISRLDDVDALAQWCDQTVTRLNDVLIDRKRAGFIRAGHGDLHLGNLILDGSHVIPFDGIEFGDRLRWIDVMADVAFTVMDLRGRGHADLSARLLDRYLEASGDYDGAAVMPLYLTYRALVRAEIAAIRLTQESPDDPDAVDQRSHVDDFMNLAIAYARPAAPHLYITVGPSGSGKTTLTSPLIETLGAIRVRSDVERRRLFGMNPVQSKPHTPAGAYTPAMHQQVYDTLERHATALLRAGFNTVVDATYLKQAQRDHITACAQRLNIPYHFLVFEAPEQHLRRWIIERAQAGLDQSEADLQVLSEQLQSAEPLTTDEQTHAVRIDSTASDAATQLLQQIRA